jgi:hypothetical protein
MFKLTGKSGRRNASPGGGATQATGRIVSPYNKFRNTVAPGPRTVAFMPDTQQEHGFDNDNGPRIDE